MANISIKLKWDKPAPRSIAASLKRDTRKMMTEARKEVRKAARGVARELKQTTPRDPMKSGSHIASADNTDSGI